MNLLCLSEMGWSPMRQRSQNVVEILENEGFIQKFIFINSDVKASDLLLKLHEQLKNKKKIYRWKYVIPKKVCKAGLTFTPMVAGPDKFFFWINRLIYWIYFSWITAHLEKKTICLYINDFAAERIFLHELLLPIANKIIVDLSDDFLSFEGRPSNLERIKKNIELCVAKADLVLCINDHVLKKYSDGTDKFVVLKNAVELDPFIKAIGPDPFSRHKIPHPILGYIGTVTPSRMDTEILMAILSRFSHCSVVFLGIDVRRFCEKLQKKHKNFFFIESVPFEQMCLYVKNFDVGIIPHLDNEHTKGNDLLKIYNFMAAKIPIVATNVSGLHKFHEYIDIALNPEDFCKNIELHLNTRDERRLDAGFEIAKENTWETKVLPLFKGLHKRGFFDKSNND